MCGVWSTPPHHRQNSKSKPISAQCVTSPKIRDSELSSQEEGTYSWQRVQESCPFPLPACLLLKRRSKALLRDPFFFRYPPDKPVKRSIYRPVHSSFPLLVASFEVRTDGLDLAKLVQGPGDQARCLHCSTARHYCRIEECDLC